MIQPPSGTVTFLFGVWCLERLAEMAMEQGQGERAAHVFGAASALRAFTGSVVDPVDKPESERELAALHAQLDDERFDAAWDEGHSLKLVQAVEYAFGSSLQ